jgi:DNA polymerase elongation subunit (family B)
MLLSTLPKILFLDIETVSEKADYNSLDDDFKSLWRQKSAYWLRDREDPGDPEYADTYQGRAGIYAEFGKVICISMGLIILEKQEIHSFRLNSFFGDQESELLSQFAAMLNKFFPDPNTHYICGHNIKEFDIPYLARRMIINGIKLPNLLDIAGKKPWEVRFLLDTLEMWKFGDYKHYTSLKLLAHILGIPSPKDDIDGSQVGKVYWEENDLERIKVYCEKDVVTTASVFLRLNNLPEIAENKIISAF